MVTYNRPGAPTNPPQHTADERPLPEGGDIDRGTSKHHQTGPGTAPPERDVADPHGNDENHERSRGKRGGRSRFPAG